MLPVVYNQKTCPGSFHPGQVLLFALTVALVVHAAGAALGAVSWAAAAAALLYIPQGIDRPCDYREDEQYFKPNQTISTPIWYTAKVTSQATISWKAAVKSIYRVLDSRFTVASVAAQGM